MSYSSALGSIGGGFLFDKLASKDRILVAVGLVVAAIGEIFKLDQTLCYCSNS